MSEEMGTMCYNQEYKQTLDDCGSVGCSLTKEVWDEWKHEDNCECCPWAAIDDID